MAAQIEALDLSVRGVSFEVWLHGGLRRADLQPGDLLGGEGVATHGAELVTVGEMHNRGVWLKSAAGVRATWGTPPATAPRFITWAGLAALHPVVRLRLDLTTVAVMPQSIRAPEEWFITPKGRLVRARGGVWMDALGTLIALPIGAELYSLAAELPRG